MIREFVLRICGIVLASWAILVGFMMMLASDARFTSVQWKFILEVPGGQETFGWIFAIAGMALAVGIALDKPKLQQAASLCMGLVATVFATTLGIAAAMEHTGGIMGFPTFGVIGIFYIIYANLVTFNR